MSDDPYELRGRELFRLRLGFAVTDPRALSIATTVEMPVYYEVLLGAQWESEWSRVRMERCVEEFRRRPSWWALRGALAESFRSAWLEAQGR